MSVLITEWVSFDTLSGTRRRISKDLINIDESRLKNINCPNDERRIVLTDGRQYIARNISIEQQEELTPPVQTWHQRGRV